MKKLGEIRLMQNIASGADASEKTKMYIMLINNSHIEITHDPDKARIYQHCGDTIQGYINIVHPALMYGTEEDILRKFYGVTRKHLLENGYIANDYGVLFPK